MKKLLAIAVAAALVAPAAAMADTTLYGKLHASVGTVKDTTDGVSTTRSAVESHSSRFGIKGATALDNGMEATYGLEYGLSLDGDAGANGTTDNLQSRNTFVGVKGNFGEVRVGKHDTPAKLATAGLDVFADTYAAMENIIATDAHRVNNAVAYINKIGPVGVAVAHSTSAGSLNGLATGLSNGTASIGNTGANDSTDYSANANTMMVNYSNGPWYAGLGHTAIQPTTLTGGFAGSQAAAKMTNVGLGWKSEAGHNVGLVHEDVKLTLKDVAGVDPDTSIKLKNTYLAGGYKMGNVTLKAGYGTSKQKDAGTEKQTTLGVDYSLGKKTSVYLLSNQIKNADHNNDTADKSRQTALGLVTEF